MRVIALSQPVEVGEREYSYQLSAGKRYVVNNREAEALARSPMARYLNENEKFYVGLVRPDSWSGKRVIFYVTAGVGDWLVLSAAISKIKKLGGVPFVACGARHKTLFAGNPDTDVIPWPIGLEDLQRFEFPVLLEGIYTRSWIGENAYDALFDLLGIEGTPDEKRPVFNISNEEARRRDSWLKSQGVEGYIAIQPLAESEGRSMPLPVIRMVLKAAAAVARERGWKVVVLHHTPFEVEIEQAIREFGAVNLAGKTPDCREFGVIIGGAKAFIGPDTSGLHFSHACNVPSVGLWASYSPSTRNAKYDPATIFLWHPERCRHAPCFSRGFLPDKCPEGKSQQHCAVFDGLSYDEIREALFDALG
jgi:Glycosyltransferase family 9 (heptosyltransferase)